MYMTRLKKICRKIQNFFSKVEIGIEAAAKGVSFSFVSNSIWRQRKRGFLLTSTVVQHLQLRAEHNLYLET